MRGKPSNPLRLRSDEEAERILIDNLGLLYFHANRWRNVPMDREDRISFAGEGMVVASRLWNPDLSSFATFSGICIDSLIKNELKKRRLKRKGLPEWQLPECHLSDKVLAIEGRPPSPDKIDSLLLKTLIDRCHVPPRQREAVEAFARGESVSSLAEKWGCSPQNVSEALQRGRKHIAKSLAKSPFADLIPNSWPIAA